jgi:hypothetical protein
LNGDAAAKFDPSFGGLDRISAAYSRDRDAPHWLHGTQRRLRDYPKLLPLQEMPLGCGSGTKEEVQALQAAL